MRNYVLLLFFPSFLYCQTTQWVKSFGGKLSDKGISIGADSLGNVYVSGFYNTSADFGSINLTNEDSLGANKEAFLIKLDSSGTVLWALSGGNQNGPCCDDRALGMHVTPSGDVYLTGTFWSEFKIGNCFIPESNAHDTSVLTKVNANGNCEWAIHFGSDMWDGLCPYPIFNGDDHSYDVKVDDEGFIYVTGFFSGTSALFDQLQINNTEWEESCKPKGYVGKLNPSGEWLWVKAFDGIYDDRGSRDNRIAIDEFSNVYVCGGFEGKGDYGNLSLNSNGEFDVFLFKIDSDGNWLWVKNVGSNKSDRANGIAIDHCNDIYINGEYRNPMVFSGANASNGSDTLSHRKKRDIFVAKCDPQGNWIWAKRARSRGTDKPYQMSVDENKQVYVCGMISDTTKFSENVILYPPHSNDTTRSAFIAQLDGNGNGEWLWAKSAGSYTDDDDRTNDVCPDGFGHIYGVGFFEDEAKFDNLTLTSQGRKDIFVWKMSVEEREYVSINTFDTIRKENIVCDIAEVGTYISHDTVLVSCDTTFINTITNNVLDTSIETINYIYEVYEYSCSALDTGRFKTYSAKSIVNCDTLITDSILYVKLLPSNKQYNSITIQDSTCNPIDTGLVIISSDTLIVKCDTLFSNVFKYYSLIDSTNCDDKNCKTLDYYDFEECICRNIEKIPNDCLDLFFPNAFTPNEDGKNESFKPKISNSHLIKEYQLMVFNRWGSIIFFTQNYNEGWKTEKTQIGVYMWLVYITDYKGNRKRYIGEVNLLD